MADESGNRNALPPVPILGYSDVNEYAQKALRSVMGAIRTSNALPKSGDDFDYYSSFESFRCYMDVESDKIIDIMQNLMRYLGVKGSLPSADAAGQLEDGFDILTDVNDILLERAGTFLDEASGYKKDESKLVVTTFNERSNLTASWNRKQKETSSQISRHFGRHMPKPQLAFMHSIDNSIQPFVPKIIEKPHAMKPIPCSIISAQTGQEFNELEQGNSQDVETLPHPYAYEIEHFKITDEQLLCNDIKEMPRPISKPAKFINTKEGLLNLCDILGKEKEIAVDLEAHTYRSFLGITCLIQFSTRTEDFVVDPLPIWTDLYLLNNVFANPNIVKVFHGANSDILWLQRDFGLYVVNMFDTYQAAKLLAMPRLSLAYLLDKYCDVQADKQYQLADWRIRPIPDDMMKYAQQDTHYLLYIYDKLRETLLDVANGRTNMLVSVIDASRQVCSQRFEKPRYNDFDITALVTKSKKTFNARQYYVLKKLFFWRERVAREKDESLGFVLPNHMMLQISQVLPRESAGILACCNPTPLLVKRSLNEIHSYVLEAKDLSLHKPQPVKKSSLKIEEISTNKYVEMLNLSHDTSHQRPFIDIPTGTNSVRVKKQSDLLIEDRQTSSGHVTTNKMSIDCNLSDNQDKVAAIYSSFTNLFEKYLPTSAKPTDNLSIQVDQWKLLPHSEPVKKTLNTTVPQVVSVGSVPPWASSGGATVMIDDEEESEDEKEVEDWNDKRSEITTDNVALPNDVQPILFTPQPIGSKKKKKRKNENYQYSSSRVDDSDEEAGIVIGVTKPKREKLTMEKVAEGFKAKDYSQTDYSVFSAGPSKNKKEFDMDNGEIHRKGSRGNKKSGPKRSKNDKGSLSFSQLKGSRQVNWPKK